MNIDTSIHASNEADDGNKIKMDFYEVKTGKTKELHTCEGDVIKTINALADYADILDKFAETSIENFQRAFYQQHAATLRKISRKWQEEIGYDRDAALERCRKIQRRNDRNEDVGGDALELAMSRRRKSEKKDVEEER